MQVKLLEGRRAGEEVEMPYHFAAPLIATGRVEVPGVNVTETPLETSSVITASPEVPASRPDTTIKRKGR